MPQKLSLPPSPERLIQVEIEVFLRRFHTIETPGGLQGALWQFAAQVYNLGSMMQGSVDPRYGPPAVVIERLMQEIGVSGVLQEEKQRGAA